MSTLTDRLIGRLPDEERIKVLDQLAAELAPVGSTVLVEHAYTRKLADAKSVVATIVGVAYAPTGGSSTVLVVKPVDPRKRLIAIPAAHVCRVRWASVYGPEAPEEWRGKAILGAVIAGPPVDR